MKNLVSVIMSTYQEPLVWIDEAVSSIQNQTYQNFEFIIVVDDPDYKQLVGYILRKKKEDNRIIVHINERNKGLTESLNIAVKMAKGTYIARMDADDIAAPDRLECELDYLILNHLDLVGCNVRNIDEDGNVINHTGTKYPASDQIIKRYLKTNSAVVHPTWLVRKEVYNEMDMYRDFPACEDYEFLTRIALAGYRIGNVREVKQMYRINGKGISSTKKVMQKTSHYFAKCNYNAGRQSSLDEFYKFLNSDEGKKKQAGLVRYYEQSDKLKECYRNKQWGKLVTMGFGVFMRSKEGRTVITSTLMEKFLRIRYRKTY